MFNRQRTSALLLILLLAVLAIIGIRFTSNSADQAQNTSRRRARTPQEQQARNAQRSFQTAQDLSKLVSTRDEDRISRDILQVADHDLDLAFTTALRESQLHPPTPTPETQKARARIRELKEQIKSDQAQVIKLSSRINAGKAADDELQRQLDLTEADLSLHMEELEGAQQSLARTGDDVESRIQRMMDIHRASQHKDDNAQPPAWNRYPPYQVPTNIFTQVRELKALRDKRNKILEAQSAAAQTATETDQRHDELEKQLGDKIAADQTSQQQKTASVQVAAIEQLSQERKLITDYDRRTQDETQLAQTYGTWAALLATRQLANVHAILIDVIWILVILAGLVFADYLIDRFFLQTLKGDRRRTLTARTIARFALRFVGLVLILFVAFGKPDQFATILGLVTAGLTVALQDFILAFLGWFVLMGKNGIRVGDWVEINGITGEVMEITLVRTALLETGNWTDLGHPTGRRVTFINSFAIKGHYFNFSTGGQWLWDTLEVAVPPGQDPFPITDQVYDAVVRETEANAKLAEGEWQHIAHKHGLESFSAAPSINVRPTGGGVNIVVRYITSANHRYETRTRLYRAVVELLQHRATAARS